jgi:phage shock protein A
MIQRFHPSALGAFLALALLGAPGVAGAADKATKSGTAKSGDSVLTPAQLRACEAQKERLQTQTDDALKDRAAIDQERAELNRVASALGAEAAEVDRSSAEAVDAYNAKVQAQGQRADALEARIAAFNAKAENVKTSKEAYAQACGNRRYDERDLDDIKRKQK